jgi:hypothetical protein
MMLFDEAIQDMAQRFGLDPDELLNYSYEDDHSGWDGGVGDWPIGSLWTVEGRVLYALVRALKPQLVVEIGTHVGCSTTHIASALKMNGSGQVMTFDIANPINIPGMDEVHRQGDMIPQELWPYVEMVQGDGVQYIELDLLEADMIYEDGDHSEDNVNRVWKAGVPKLTPDGVIASHDAAHWLVGDAICTGIRNAGYEPIIYAIRPSDCGLGLYQKPKGKAKEPYKTTETIPDHLRGFIPKANENSEDGVVVDYAFPDMPDYELTPDFEEMTVKELREYASEHDISLGSVTKKAEIIETLEESI